MQRPPSPRTLDELLRPGGPLRIIAHRGLSGLAPENTLPAFARALELGVDMVELDVLLSADGEVVVLHDAELDRTTDGHGLVSASTLAELETLDAGSWFSPTFAGTPIPTLSAVFELLGGRLPLNVEIKTEAVGRDAEGGVVERVLQLVREHGLTEQVLLSSFDERALSQALTLDPRVRRAVLLDATTAPGEEPRRDPTGLLLSTEAAALHLAADALTPALLRQAHDLGIIVGVYTVNEPDRMLELVGLGVEAVFTDRADLMLDALARRDGNR